MPKKFNYLSSKHYHKYLTLNSFKYLNKKYDVSFLLKNNFFKIKIMNITN